MIVVVAYVRVAEEGDPVAAVHELGAEEDPWRLVAVAAAQPDPAEGDAHGVGSDPPDAVDVGVRGLEVAVVVGGDDLAAAAELGDGEGLDGRRLLRLAMGVGGRRADVQERVSNYPAPPRGL